MFITFEGCDGSGKSTQLRFAKEYLESVGIPVLATREPGGSVVAEKIRSIILSTESVGMTAETELLLYTAARVQHVEEIVLPALEAGKVVLCDRFIDSTIAYQGVARGLGIDHVVALFESTCGLYPDLTIWMDVDSASAFERKGGVDEDDRLEAEGKSFHEKVYDGYRRAYERYPDRIVRVVADKTKWDTKALIQGILAEKLHV